MVPPARPMRSAATSRNAPTARRALLRDAFPHQRESIMQENLERLPPLIFVVAFAAFWTWEWIDAARAAPGERGRKGRNLALTAINFVLAGVIASILVAASGWVARE